MYRTEKGQEKRLAAPGDPIRNISGVMAIDGLTPELTFSVEYYSFGNKRRYITNYKMTRPLGIRPSSVLVTRKFWPWKQLLT